MTDIAVYVVATQDPLSLTWDVRGVYTTHERAKEAVAMLGRAALIFTDQALTLDAMPTEAVLAEVRNQWDKYGFTPEENYYD